MATIALVGVLIGRPAATGSILAAAVLVLVILDPWLVWSIGFQLSVAATAGMVALASPIGERLRRFVPAPVALAAGTTLAAQLGVTPLLLFHFHEVPGVTHHREPHRVPGGLARAPVRARRRRDRAGIGGCRSPARRVRADPDALPRVGRGPSGEGARRPRDIGRRSGAC